MVLIPEPAAFEWDAGNREKNFHSHGVDWEEIEEVFFSERKLLLDDVLHSARESRYVLLGETREGRALFVVFTIRRAKVRIISARDLNKKERTLYEEAHTNSSL